jgi:signal peptidase I
MQHHIIKSLNLQIQKKFINNFINKFSKKKSLIEPVINKSNQDQSKPSNFFSSFIFALFFALLIRSFLYEPFHIPSGSMKPNLLVGDYIFVNKYAYGFSKYSLPFSPNIFSGRIFFTSPKRGDMVVFRYPADPNINYIKRLIGLPGDRIQMRHGNLFINDQVISKEIFGEFNDEIEHQLITLTKYQETLPEGKKIYVLDTDNSVQDNTGIYEVPEGHYFMMGDNRDNSQDSRFIDQVGFVAEENLVGRASMIFFSNNQPFWKFWLWLDSIRFKRIFKNISNE